MKQMYRVTVAGEFVQALSKTQRELVDFEASFDLDKKDGEALSEIQNNLIIPHLKSKYTGVRSFRTCAIVSQEPISSSKAAPAAAKTETQTPPTEPTAPTPDVAPAKPTKPAKAKPAKGNKGKGKGKAAGDFPDEV